MAIPATAGPPVTASPRLMWAILGLVLLADALDMIDATVTNIAAPTITAELHGGEGLIKWLGSAYMLAMGVLLVVGGRLGDKYGQRRLFLIGMSGFTIASAVAGLSPNPALLVLARGAQGAFGALLIPQGMAIMTKTFSRDMLTKAFGMFGPLLGIASVGGPILAGFVIDADIAGLSWRPIFLVNLVLGGLGLVLAVRLLPQDDGDASTGVDGVGSGLLAAIMFGLLLGLVEGSSNGWTAIPILSIVAGLVFLAAFARRQSTAADPLLKPSLLRNRGFSSGLLVGLIVFAATTGLVYVLSLFMQQGLHASARDASLGLLPMTVGIIVAAGACMALIKKMGRTLIFLGLAIILIGCGWLLVLVTSSGTDLSLWTLAPAVFLTGLGMGACYGTIFDIAIGDIDPDEAGSASGSLSAIQQLAAGIGSAAVTSVFFQSTASGLGHAMTTSLVVVVALTAITVPAVILMPRRAPEELQH
ncbi:EmrB/QacA subfamily drug resistance transporter [Streptosporangium album]|uniref:EmrB/QacA subfamily drug resistance transporter n=1 Tax=Streptosporangium album TaxID=47479 RepID=A0A7W7WDN5_9ACTN|nr:MFS transporter [Streptosporangium album]MBB4943306.1 EmrB/QacA subfamily drug resistance transporter [Streptosporangium album]